MGYPHPSPGITSLGAAPARIPPGVPRSVQVLPLQRSLAEPNSTARAEELPGKHERPSAALHKTLPELQAGQIQAVRDVPSSSP